VSDPALKVELCAMCVVSARVSAMLDVARLQNRDEKPAIDLAIVTRMCWRISAPPRWTPVWTFARGGDGGSARHARLEARSQVPGKPGGNALFHAAGADRVANRSGSVPSAMTDRISPDARPMIEPFQSGNTAGWRDLAIDRSESGRMGANDRDVGSERTTAASFPEAAFATQVKPISWYRAT